MSIPDGKLYGEVRRIVELARTSAFSRAIHGV